MHLSKKIFSVVFVMTLSSFSQTGISHAMYVEAAGSGFLYSVNYEIQFHHSQQFATGLRAGLGCMYFGEETGKIGAPHGLLIPIPLMISEIVGQGPHKIEFGFGLLSSIANEEESSQFFCLSAGYRYQRQPEGLILRVTLTPFVDTGWSAKTVTGFTLWGGASVGWAY